MPMPSAVSDAAQPMRDDATGAIEADEVWLRMRQCFISAFTGSSVRGAPRRQDAEYEAARDRDGDGGRRRPRRAPAKSSTGNASVSTQDAADADREADAPRRAATGSAASVRNSAMICRLRAPTAFEQADLGGALAHRDEHHVHDQHAGDDEADRGDRRRARP